MRKYLHREDIGYCEECGRVNVYREREGERICCEERVRDECERVEEEEDLL